MFSFFKNKTDPKARLKEILKGYELPSFPAIVMQVLQQIRKPNSSASDIAKTLSIDPGLSVKVLSIANSAAFSPNRKIQNITQAIALVGMSQLESLVLAVGVTRGIPKSKCAWHDPGQFWLTSARRAVLANEIAMILCPAKGSECFTAAFLQDMALPFLACNRVDVYDSIFKQWQLEGGNLVRMERESLDWDHAEVATWICSEWGLPESIAMAIKNHHDDATNGHSEALAPVRLVSFLRENDTNDGIEELIETACNHYHIPRDKMVAIVNSSIEKARDLARLIV